jgi:integrase
MNGAQWRDLDLKARRWKVPKDRMKGRKAPHIVPLASQTLELLGVKGGVKGVLPHFW